MWHAIFISKYIRWKKGNKCVVGKCDTSQECTRDFFFVSNQSETRVERYRERKTNCQQREHFRFQSLSHGLHICILFASKFMSQIKSHHFISRATGKTIVVILINYTRIRWYKTKQKINDIERRVANHICISLLPPAPNMLNKLNRLCACPHIRLSDGVFIHFRPWHKSNKNCLQHFRQFTDTQPHCSSRIYFDGNKFVWSIFIFISLTRVWVWHPQI